MKGEPWDVSCVTRRTKILYIQVVVPDVSHSLTIGTELGMHHSGLAGVSLWDAGVSNADRTANSPRGRSCATPADCSRK